MQFPQWFSKHWKPNGVGTLWSLQYLSVLRSAVFYTPNVRVSSAWLLFSSRLQTPQRQNCFLLTMLPLQCFMPSRLCVINWGKKTKTEIKIILWLKTADRIDICGTLFTPTPLQLLYMQISYLSSCIWRSPLNANSYSFGLHIATK